MTDLAAQVQELAQQLEQLRVLVGVLALCNGFVAVVSVAGLLLTRDVQRAQQEQARDVAEAGAYARERRAMRLDRRRERCGTGETRPPAQ